MPVTRVIGALGTPMGICPVRVKKLQISTNTFNDGNDMKIIFFIRNISKSLVIS